MRTAKVSVDYPVMAIRRVSKGLKRTAIEPATVTIRFDDGQVLVIKNVTIPATDVRELSVLEWLVDACVATYYTAWSCVKIELPEEPCNWSTQHMTIVARAITTVITVKLADGSIGTGTVLNPDCPIKLFPPPMEATEIVGTGTVTFADATGRGE